MTVTSGLAYYATAFVIWEKRFVVKDEDCLNFHFYET